MKKYIKDSDKYLNPNDGCPECGSEESLDPVHSPSWDYMEFECKECGWYFAGKIFLIEK
ncbi:MAG: hypothetical protein ACOCRK_05775 [bacterium]